MTQNIRGTVDSAKSYTLVELAEMFDCRQERTVYEWLERLGVGGVEAPKKGRVYSGRLINYGIERHSSCTQPEER